MQPGYGPPPAGERWNVNMPAVIGVVFVFLVGVVVWVIASSAGDDDEGLAQSTSTSPAGAGASATSTIPSATASTPPSQSTTPLPSTVPPTEPTTATTSTTTTVPATSPTAPAPATTPTTAAPAPTTTAPGAGSGAVPGDLGIPARPMQRPACDGGYITVLASPIGAQATAASVAAVLDQYPGSKYLRTDQTCSSLNSSSGGEPIYVIFFGPFARDSEACSARSDGPEGAYARQLSNDVSPDHFVQCT